MNRHMPMPSGATIQTSGVRNGRFTFGRWTRSTMMPAQTMTNGGKRADGDELAKDVERQRAGEQRAEEAGEQRTAPGRLEAWMNLANIGGIIPSFAIA